MQHVLKRFPKKSAVGVNNFDEDTLPPHPRP